MVVNGCPRKETHLQLSTWVVCGRSKSELPEKYLNPSLLKNYGASLSDASLQTLLAEAEAMVSSRPLITDLLIDVNSLILLSPLNLLTIKSKVVMAPPGVF